MSSGKDFGGLLGSLVGGVIGGPIKFIGEVTDVKLIEEIGDGVINSTKFTGETVGQVVGGSVNAIRGVVTDDRTLIDEGLGDLGDAGSRTLTGVVNTAKHAVENGGNVIIGIMDNDIEQVKQGASGLVKTAAVGALAVGVIDIAGDIGIDADTGTDVASSDTISSDDAINDAELHHVNPHYVEGYDRADGTHVEGYWRDGDGNTSVNLSEEQGGGYMQSNPDNQTENNLG